MISAISGAMYANTMANNAMYNSMRCSDSLIRAASNPNMSLAQAHRMDQAYSQQMLKNNLQYKMSKAMEEANKKRLNDSIKRTYA